MANIKAHFFGMAQAESPSVYDDATGAFSLRKFFGWDKAVLKIRRSSDDAEANIFFNGASSQETITLSSYISTVSNTTPSTTTLGTWLGSDDGFILGWYFQTPSLIINIIPIQVTSSLQPIFASGGVLEVDGSKIAIKFVDDFLVSSDFITEIDSANEFTILSVSHNTLSNNWAGLFGSYANTNDGFFVHNDRSTGRRILTQRGTPAVTYFCQYPVQENTSTKKLLTGIHNATNNIAYSNGTLIESTAHLSATYVNTDVVIGTFKPSLSKLTGYIQEIIIFPSDKTSELPSINSDINSYYSIY